MKEASKFFILTNRVCKVYLMMILTMHHDLQDMLMFINKISMLGLNVFSKQLPVSTLYSYCHSNCLMSGASGVIPLEE